MVETERPWEQPKAKGRRVKRRQVQASDGWTVVTHASGHSRGSGGNGEKMVLQEARPSRVVEGLTVATLIDEFGKCEKRWRDTECAKQVEAIFARRKWDIQEAICIGIGSFSVDWEHRYRSMWQLVLFMAVVELGTPLYNTCYTSTYLLTVAQQPKKDAKSGYVLKSQPSTPWISPFSRHSTSPFYPLMLNPAS